MEKTNAIRLLDQKKIKYAIHYYDSEVAVSGMEVASILNEDIHRVFKTLVTVGKSKRNYVFVIPVHEELNLKMAAAAANEKSIELIRSKELLPLTGYIHGGCTPIGMKKTFKTFIDESAYQFDTFYISGGKRGIQIEINPFEIEKIIPIVKAKLY